MSNKLYTVQSTKGTLSFQIDEDGFIRMQNPQTIGRYQELRYGKQPSLEELGLMAAFNKAQFAEGYLSLKEKGHVKEPKELISFGAGIFGTQKGYDKYTEWIEQREEAIKHECDPQEVYFFEHGNHESCINYEGDTDAIKLIIDIWGVEIAKSIYRRNVCMSVDVIVAKPIETTGLYYIENGEKKQPDKLYFSSYTDERTGDVEGDAFASIRFSITPCYKADGTRLRIEWLSGMNARYDGNKIYGFYYE